VEENAEDVPDCSLRMSATGMYIYLLWTVSWTYLKDSACGGGTGVSGPQASAFLRCAGKSAFQSSKALSRLSRSFVRWLSGRDFRLSPYIVFTTWFKIMLSLQSSEKVDTL
jgi:hypothetical protein